MTLGDSVVVGIDGSNTAVDTAPWAVREAVVRDVPLKLVFSANTVRTQGHRELTGPDVGPHDHAVLRHGYCSVLVAR